MDPLEKTFGREEEDITLGRDIKYKPNDKVMVCIKRAGPNGVLIEVSEGKIVSYEGKERYIPPGCFFIKISEYGETTRGKTTSSNRDIGHRYLVNLSDGSLREFGQADIYPEKTSQEYIFENAFLHR